MSNLFTKVFNKTSKPKRQTKGYNRSDNIDVYLEIRDMLNIITMLEPKQIKDAVAHFRTWDAKYSKYSYSKVTSIYHNTLEIIHKLENK